MIHGQRLGVATIFTAAILALALLPTAAHAGPMLLARGASGEDRGVFPLARTEVEADVSGQVLSVDVTQRFQNPYPDRIEAVYTFPLPNNAAVDAMEIQIGDRVVRAAVLRRAEARAVYDRAVQQGQRAGLLEQERPNVFTFAVANIDPGHEIVVRMHYFELARYDHGTYEMVFPTVVGPRYIPGQATGAPPTGTGTHPDTDRVPDASRVSPAYVAPTSIAGNTLGITVHLHAGTPIESVDAPAHAIDVQRASRSTAEITLRHLAEIPNRDFILRWRLAAPEVQAAVFAHRPEANADGYVALMIEPRHDAPDAEIAARELIFLLDTSGSMQGRPLQTAVSAVRRALVTLHPSDTFQIIDFADRASSFAPAPVPNTPANVIHAMQYLDVLSGSGGTNQLVGIHAALSAPGDPMRVRYVVFMTDGYIGNESEVIGLVQREIGDARIFGFGIGSNVNRYLLDEVSHAGRGVAEYLRPNEDPAALVERFYERIGRPYLTNIQIDWGNLQVDQVLPSPVPDLSTFEPLLVLARYRAGGSSVVTVRGRLGGRAFAHPYPVTLPAMTQDNRAVSRIWAREQITGLSRAIHFAGEQPALVNQIVDAALAHNLVSQYTSLVAVDLTPTGQSANSPPRQVTQPALTPEGVATPGTASSAASAPQPGVPPALAQYGVPAGAASGPVTGAPHPVAPPIYAEGRYQMMLRPQEVSTPPTTTGTPAREVQTVPGVAMNSDSERRTAPRSEQGIVVNSMSQRRGACAGCSVDAAATRGRHVALVFAGLAVALLAARRRRHR